jgi:mono/diheme cytochrome c family protein
LLLAQTAAAVPGLYRYRKEKNVMRKALKIIGIILVVLAGIVGLVAIISSVVANSRLNKTYDVPSDTITIPTDAASIARGAILVNSICADCHGSNFAGNMMIDEPAMGTVYAANITPSEAGVGSFSDADYVRAIRHAVDPEGHALFIMPAEVFINWSAEDLGATIAYLKSLPPNDNVVPERSLGPMGRIMFAAGVMGDIMPATYIDHSTPLVSSPAIGATAEYGEYFVNAFACTLCHGEDMRGGTPPPDFEIEGDVPSAVDAAAAWSTDEFVRAVTQGVTPDGDHLDESMPFEMYANFSSEELAAVHLFLQSQAGE